MEFIYNDSLFIITSNICLAICLSIYSSVGHSINHMCDKYIIQKYLIG